MGSWNRLRATYSYFVSGYKHFILHFIGESSRQITVASKIRPCRINGVYSIHDWRYNTIKFRKKRSSRPEVFCKKTVLWNFIKSNRKHLCQSLFFTEHLWTTASERKLLSFPAKLGGLRIPVFSEFTAWKVSKYGVISGPYFPVFWPEITPYLDTFHVVVFLKSIQHFTLTERPSANKDCKPSNKIWNQFKTQKY